jgi:hypothetical protein
MNTTISSPTFDSNWKRFKGQYLATVCGLALATVSVAAISNSKSDDTNATGPSRAGQPVPVRNIDNTMHHLIIVGSQDEASRLQTLIDQDGAIRSSTTTYKVVAANSDEEERDILATHEDSTYHFQSLRAPLAALTSVPVDQPQFAPAAEEEDTAKSFGLVRNESIDEYAARERAQIDLISGPVGQQQFGTADSEYAGRSLQSDLVPTVASTGAATNPDIMAPVVSTQDALYGIEIERRKAADADIAASV